MYKRTKALMILLAGMVVFLSSCVGPQAVSQKCNLMKDAYDGWHLGVMAWTFNRYTFYEAIDKTAAMGMHYIQGSLNQQISKEKPDVKFSYRMHPEIREEIKQKLTQSNMKMLSFWADFPNDWRICRKIFDFAKDMGVETIVTEEPAERYDMLEKLSEEYNIKIAIHNHPKPSRFWHPDRVLEVCKGRSKLIGACADTGHWMRSGIDPIEALKKLKGRIVCLHFKDLNEFGNKDAHDVIWGTGKGDVKGMLEELNRQKFKGELSFEYEYHWTSSMPEIRKSVEYYNKVAKKLQATAHLR